MSWIILCLLLATAAHAAVIGVPGEQPTIQAALDASASGDTVLVERGVYQEHLISPNHGYTLMSRWPMTRDSADWLETILDGTDSGTCLRIPGTGFEWVSLQGLVVANGHGTGFPGGIHSKDSVNVEVRNLILRDHRADGQHGGESAATCMRLRVSVRNARISNLQVINTVGDTRANVTVDTDQNLWLDSLDFDGAGNAGYAGRFWSRDSLWASHVHYHDFNPSVYASNISANSFTYLRDFEINNCNGNAGTVFWFGDGHSVYRNFHIHDCVHTGTGEFQNAAIAILAADHVDIDSLIVENTTMTESDAVEIERYTNGDSNQPWGDVNHLIVRNNYAGGINADGHEYPGRIMAIYDCNLRNSIFTGNTTDLPFGSTEFTEVALRHGSTLLFQAQSSTDSLFFENVEISHNTVIDHDDEWGVFENTGAEYVFGNLGRAVFILIGENRVTTIRDCIFHDNRLNTIAPETDFYWSLGSTVHVLDGSAGDADDTIIERCSFTDNSEGGLMTEYGGNFTIRDCVLRNNPRYGMYLTGHRFNIQNVVIDSCVAMDYAVQGYPSRQCAIKVVQVSTTPGVFRNITIRNCEMRNLFSGAYPDQSETIFQNFLMVNNSYDNLQTFWNRPDLDQPIRFVNCFMPEVPPVEEGTYLGWDPQFDNELGFPWLSPTSPCVDMGTDTAETQDIEDPDNPGFALWPSQGGLRNDIGYTGGPGAGTLDHLVALRPPVKEATPRPTDFVLQSAFPNPFNPTTTLSYVLDRPLQVELSVYNVLGQKVRTLVSGMERPGEHHVRFDASELASGVYIVELAAGGESRTQKILLLK